jgi:hypothetical protein
MSDTLNSFQILFLLTEIFEYESCSPYQTPRKFIQRGLITREICEKGLIPRRNLVRGV